MILALLLLLLGIGTLSQLESFNSKEQSLSSQVTTHLSVQERINQQLKSVNVSSDLRKRLIEFHNSEAKDLSVENGSVFLSKPDASGASLSLEQESHGESVVKDLHEVMRSSDDKYKTPGDVIDQRLSRNQFLSDYDNKYENEYIRRFINNAREQGYQVELNDQLEVVDIREAPRKEAQRFPNSTK